MQMSEYEIQQKFRRNTDDTEKSKRDYIKLLSELNGCTPDRIEKIVYKKLKQPFVPKKTISTKNLTHKDEKINIESEYCVSNGIEAQIANEALICYICSLREDNERLKTLQNRQGKVGRIWDNIGWRIEINDQKIQIMKQMLER